MTRSALRCITFILAVLLARDGLPTSKPKGKPTPCAGGRFVIEGGGPPLLSPTATTPDAITVAAGQVAIASGCNPTAATVRARRKGTRVSARWSQCGDLRLVRLRATITHPECTRLTGTIRRKGATRVTFTATIDPGGVPTTTTTLPPGSVTGLAAIYKLRDDIFASEPRGQRYVALFEAHRTEVVAWLMHEPGLIGFGTPAFLAWLPHFEALVTGRGGSAVITAEQIAALEEFFARLLVPASPDLKATITTELAAMAPLSRFVGLSMTQALDAVFAVPVPSMATPAPRGRGGEGGCPVMCFFGVCTY